MQPLKSPGTLAGILSLVTGGMMLPFWYIYLFVGAPTGTPLWRAAANQLEYDFSANSILRWYLLLQALVPLVLVAVGVTYLRIKTPTKQLGTLLVVVLALAAACALALNYWELVIMLAATLFYGVKFARGA